MTTTAPVPAYAVVRARLGLVGLLLGLAALAWWVTAERMAGMDAGPGTNLGAIGWFLGVWIVMMAAMMLPSVAPTAALYAQRAGTRGWRRPLMFTTGYLLVWGAAGVVAYGIFSLGRDAFGSALAWHSGGRWLAAGILVAAALFELTPSKQRCLRECRSAPRSSTDGALAALRSGAANGAWCLGCCSGLMAALFALGVMSLTWMTVIAVLIAVEKMISWPRAATWGSAALLAVIAVGLLAAPHSVPGLVVPGGGHHGVSMPSMNTMG
ncbi:MAG: DUF2182 domain-containing protein [Solirubrobacterales bacterium]|nr:DUF2182 domain-containing protein [Solirubrobacterales bacterium]